jgi:hypothetical protein
MPYECLPNWENESAEDLARIRIYQGYLRTDFWGGTIIRDADSLGGIAFGRMKGLEAVAIDGDVEHCCGNFSSLLLLPSLRLLQIEPEPESTFREVDRIARDLGGRRADHVETLVWALGYHQHPNSCLQQLRQLLKLFPNLKGLRVTSHVLMADPISVLRLGSLVSTELPHLSELVLGPRKVRGDFDSGEITPNVLSGLGTGWALAPVARTYRDRTLRFVAGARDRAEFSSYFFEDKFFSEF